MPRLGGWRRNALAAGQGSRGRARGVPDDAGDQRGLSVAGEGPDGGTGIEAVRDLEVRALIRPEAMARDGRGRSDIALSPHAVG
jgi:hypothetical protein